MEVITAMQQSQIYETETYGMCFVLNLRVLHYDFMPAKFGNETICENCAPQIYGTIHCAIYCTYMRIHMPVNARRE